MTAFLDTHWGHLATKPAQSVALWGLAAWFLAMSPPLAVGIALGVPALYSGIRKQMLWPGSMATAEGWKDLTADTVAGACGVLPLALNWPWGVVGVGACLLLLGPIGLHRWALP